MFSLVLLARTHLSTHSSSIIKLRTSKDKLDLKIAFQEGLKLGIEIGD